MNAKTKNTLLSWVVGFPIVTYFPLNSWQFWFLGLGAFEIFWLATIALPVWADKPRRVK